MNFEVRVNVSMYNVNYLPLYRCSCKIQLLTIFYGGRAHESADTMDHHTASPSPVCLTPGRGAEQSLHSWGGFSISRDYGSGGTCLWGNFTANTRMHLKIGLSSEDAYTRDFRHLVRVVANHNLQSGRGLGACSLGCPEATVAAMPC